MMMDRIVRSAETALDVQKFEHRTEFGSTHDSISRSSYHIAKEIGGGGNRHADLVGLDSESRIALPPEAAHYRRDPE